MTTETETPNEKNDESETTQYGAQDRPIIQKAMTDEEEQSTRKKRERRAEIKFRVEIATLFFVGIYTVVTGLEYCAAVGAVKAARNQLALMQDQTNGQQRQLRPYIDVAAGNVQPGPVPGKVTANITITASGATPALNGTICYQFVPIDLINTVDPNSFPEPPTHPNTHTPAFFDQEGMIETKGAKFFTVSSCPNTNDAEVLGLPRLFNGDIQPITASQQSMWYGLGKDEPFGDMGPYVQLALVGDVTYSDGFGTNYDTPFCFVYLKDGKPNRCSNYRKPT